MHLICIVLALVFVSGCVESVANCMLLNWVHWGSGFILLILLILLLLTLFNVLLSWTYSRVQHRIKPLLFGSSLSKSYRIMYEGCFGSSIMIFEWRAWTAKIIIITKIPKNETIYQISIEICIHNQINS